LMLLAVVALSLAYSLPALPAASRARVRQISANFLDDLRADLLDDFPDAKAPPELCRVRFETTAGDFTVTVDRTLSPLGVDRFVDLVSDGFFTDQLLYRIIPGFLIQFGVAADPAKHAQWDDWVGGRRALRDEPNRVAFRGGTLSFAGSGEDSRSCHLFFALEPNGAQLGNAMHETTLGWVDEAGMDVLYRVVQNFETAGSPDTAALQSALVERGNEAAAAFPQLDRILSTELLDPYVGAFDDGFEVAADPAVAGGTLGLGRFSQAEEVAAEVAAEVEVTEVVSSSDASGSASPLEQRFGAAPDGFEWGGFF